MAQMPHGCIASPDLSGLGAWSMDALHGPADTWPNEAITTLVRACLTPQHDTARFTPPSLDFWRWRHTAGHLRGDATPD